LHLTGHSFIPPSASNYFMRFLICLKSISSSACITHTIIKNVMSFFLYLIFTAFFFCLCNYWRQYVYHQQQKFKHIQCFHFTLIYFRLLLKTKPRSFFSSTGLFAQQVFLLLVCFTQSCYVIIIYCFTKQHSIPHWHNDIIPANR
jgi:hypothetical protein